MERPLPLVMEFTQYNPPLNKILCRRWGSIYNDQKFYSLLPNTPFTVFRNRRPLRSLLSAKRRYFDTKRYLPNLSMGREQEFVMTKFNHPKWGSWHKRETRGNTPITLQGTWLYSPIHVCCVLWDAPQSYIYVPTCIHASAYTHTYCHLIYIHTVTPPTMSWSPYLT